MELRVHGIGAPSIERVLGCDPEERSVVSWRSDDRAKSALRQRGGLPDVQAYQWAPLTSGSRWFALWPVLLPFTLANVAGFTAPRGPWRTKVHGAGAILQALGLTASAVVWLQAAAWLLWSRIHPLPERLPGDGPTQACVLGLVSGGLALVALVLIAVFSARGFERYEDPIGQEAGGAGQSFLAPKRFDDASFFNGSGALHRRALHIAVAGVAGAVTAWTIVRSDGGMAAPGRAFGHVLLVLAAANVAAACIMALASLPREQPAPLAAIEQVAPIRRTLSWRLLGAASAVVAWVLLSGMVLTAADLLVRLDERSAGAITILYPAYGWAVLGGVASVTACLVWHLRSPSPAEEAGQAGVVLTSLYARLRARVALCDHDLGIIVGSVAAVFVLAAGWTVGAQASRRGGLDAWQLEPSPPVALAHTTFFFIVGYFFLSVIKSRADQAALRRVGNVWDVLTFWPRHYHPFAVRPYAERAVPELREVLARATACEPVTVTAHSQGSVLVYAALAAVPSGCRDRVSVVTFGSPLRSLYALAFPHSVAETDLALRRTEVAGRWSNVFRFTDHVGRAVFGSDLEVASALAHAGAGPDHPVPEPDDGGVVNGHNDYWEIPAVRRAVAGGRPDAAPTDATHATAEGAR